MKVVHVSAIGFTAKRLLLPQCEYLRSRGYEVSFVFSPDPIAQELRGRGFEIKELFISRNISPIDLSASIQLAGYFMRIKPDIVHTHTSKGGIVGRLAARMAGVPRVIHTIHGFPFVEGQSGFKYFLYSKIEKWAAGFTDILLSQSEEDVETAIRLGILARRGVPIYIGNGINMVKFNKRLFDDEKRSELLRTLGIGNEPVITTIARLTWEKGYTELISALAEISRYPWRMLVIGPDDGAKTGIERMVSDCGLADRVRMLGHRDDVDDLLSISDIFVLSSYREGVPRSVIEAQAMGVPAIVTNIRGCREIVQDGETGVLVPAHDSEILGKELLRLLLDPDARKRMGEAAAVRAHSFFNEEMVFERIEAAYRDGNNNSDETITQ